MNTIRKTARGGLTALAILGGATLVERIADPFDRHEPAYTIERQQHPSDIFYVSVNYYDAEGNKHNDRSGDLMLSGTALCALGALGVPKPKLVDPAPIPQAA